MYPIQALIGVPVVPFPIQLLALWPGRSRNDALCPWANVTHMGDLEKGPGSWPLTLAWPSSGYCSHLECEPVDEQSLSAAPQLHPVTLTFKYAKKYFKKREIVKVLNRYFLEQTEMTKKKIHEEKSSQYY